MGAISRRTCDRELSWKHGRVVAGPVDTRAAPTGHPTGPREPRKTTCELCQYWLPFAVMPRVGQCDNPASTNFGSPAFSDKPTEECFIARTLEGLEFMWCQTHRQTIYAGELPEHRNCRVFVSSASLPVEDEMELTLAGD